MRLTNNIFIFQLFLLASLTACAAGTRLDEVLTEKQQPPGVVIEIVTGDAQGLQWALPMARTYVHKLRQRFPGIPVAIVTHGREQFALQNNQKNSKPKIHSLTQALRKEDVALHVCGTYAGWKGLTAEDFPDYVDVAPAGPAQVNDYRALGYRLIIIKQRVTLK